MLFILLSCLFLLISFYSFSSPLLLLVFILLFPFSSAPCIPSLLSSFCLFLLSSVSFLPSFPSFSRFHPPLNFPQIRKNRPVYAHSNHSPSQRIFSHISRTIRIRFSQKKKNDSRFSYVTFHKIRTRIDIKSVYIYLSIYTKVAGNPSDLAFDRSYLNASTLFYRGERFRATDVFHLAFVTHTFTID